jgi:peptidoglycan/xylan/chitin deacetylase (PgdA/CDA1 family)
MLVAVNFHYVRPSFDDPYPGIHGITPDALRSQLELLGRAGELVSPEQVRDAVRGRAPLPERSILVTFDDGLREQAEHALPVLRSLDVPALFFVNTAPLAEGRVSTVHQIHLLRAGHPPENVIDLLDRNARELGIALDLDSQAERATLQYRYDPPEVARLKYVLNFLLPVDDRDHLIQACFEEAFPGREAEISRELYMDLDQLKEIAGLIGTHAHEHLPLGRLPRERAAEQIRTSLELLEAWTGRRPFALSYPYGGPDACTAETGEIARELGLDFCLTMERTGNADLGRPFHLGRFACNDLPGGSSPQFTVESLFGGVLTCGSCS